MSALPLTEKQERVWLYIKSCDRSPTYEEIAQALDYKSRSNLHGTVVSLKERGFVTYKHGRARSIVALDPAPALTSFSTSQIVSELARRLAQ